MADNVNIIVQDTINDIVVNAAQIVETIDINVQAAVDVVDIVANPNNYVVNINRIIGEQVQSDWTQNDNQAPDYIKNKPTLAAVATSGDYDDLINKPTIPTNTSDLVNDGENGVDPFITAADIPPVTGFVPYTGATEDVNLGEFGLLTGNVEFDNTPTNIPTTAGAMYWNDADGTADLILKGGNVKLQIGQESVIRVVNKTATNINLLEANYQAVRVTGAQGQRLKVDLAQATNDNLSAETIGLVTETINNNQEGFITTSGLVRNINTTGSLQGETWADGDILYLSATTAGNVTKVKPTAPNHLVIIGYVVHAHANQGSIFVKVDNGYELDELHNVKITSAANNNVLAYTSATDIWENKTVETALGYTPENVANKSTSTSLGTSDTLYPTQNAVKVYADTKFTLPSLTSGSVLFSNGTTIAQDNSNLFWDNTNNRLGIGTATPAQRLMVIGVASTAPTNSTWISAGSPIGSFYGEGASGNMDFFIGGASSTAASRPVLIGRKSGGTLAVPTALVNGNSVFSFLSSGYSGTQFLNTASINMIVDGVVSTTSVPQAITFETGTSSRTERMRIASSGNILINTTTDAGFKLDVNGTARVQGELTVNTVNIGLGGGAQANNCRVGTSALASNTTGGSNTAIGAYSFFALQTGSNNTAIGRNAASSIVANASISAVGAFAFLNLNSGNDSIGFGLSAGRFLADGTTSATSFSNGVYLGNLCRVSANNATNEIVIGYQAIGAGSNTATLGNTSIVDTILRGRINIQQYATGSRPTYVKGALIYDSTLGKLVVGGNAGWEVVTSM